MTSSIHHTESALSFILVQLILMIAAARVMNTVFRRLGQPGVIGEIMAGLMLGPSLLGHFLPGVSATLFGTTAAPAITMISQIGLILLMFQIGADFEFGHLKTGRNRGAVGLIAIVSIGVPFALGLLVGQVSAPVLAPGIAPLPYSLFCGVALAITAVPILGRILREYGLTRHELGVVAISAAAINDVVGWVMLAAISAYAGSRLTASGLALQVGGLVALLAAMWFVVRPGVNWLMAKFPLRQGELPPNLVAIVICLIFVFGICTYRLGIFAIFGGFAAGLVFHRHEAFVAAWRRQVGQFVLVFFLPVFFTYTGLRTNILGLTSVTDLEWLAVVLSAAILGKVIPVYFAGRVSGFNRDDSMILGTLMNTRALMELIVLNIGYDMGFIPQKVFTILVIMAVATTVMTGPLLKVLLRQTGRAVPVGVEA